ncbi:MAG: MBL fold metallo-hydrolase, partial [Thiobacillaceae bacterium]
MRFASLGSGSRGNAWLVQKGSTLVMVDCGFGLTEVTHRLARWGVAPAAVDAVVLTHEHGDHARGAVRFAARYGCALWMTPGCRAMLAAAADLPASIRLVEANRALAIGDLELRPYPIPHD